MNGLLKSMPRTLLREYAASLRGSNALWDIPPSLGYGENPWFLREFWAWKQQPEKLDPTSWQLSYEDVVRFFAEGPSSEFSINAGDGRNPWLSWYLNPFERQALFMFSKTAPKPLQLTFKEEATGVSIVVKSLTSGESLILADGVTCITRL